MDTRQLFNLLSDQGISSDNLQQLYSTLKTLNQNQVEIPGFAEINQSLKAAGINGSNIVSKFESFKPSDVSRVNEVQEEKIDKELNSPEMQQLLDDVSNIDLVGKFRKKLSKFWHQLADEPQWGSADEKGRKEWLFNYLEGYWAKLERNAARNQNNPQQQAVNDDYSEDFSEHGLSLREILSRHLKKNDVDEVINAFILSMYSGQNLNEEGKKINAESYKKINQAFIGNRAKLGGFAKDLWKWTMWWFVDVMDRSPLHRDGRRGELAIHDNIGMGRKDIAKLMINELCAIEKTHGRFLEKIGKSTFVSSESELETSGAVEMSHDEYISVLWSQFSQEAQNFNQAFGDFNQQTKEVIAKAKADEEARIQAEAEAKEKARLAEEARFQAEVEAKARAEAEAAAKAKADAAAKERAEQEFKKKVELRVASILREEQDSRNAERNSIKISAAHIQAQYDSIKKSIDSTQAQDESYLIKKSLSQLIEDIYNHIDKLEKRSALKISAETRAAKVSVLKALVKFCINQELKNLEEMATYITSWVQKVKPHWNDHKCYPGLNVYPVRVMYDQGKKGSDTAKLVNRILPLLAIINTQIQQERKSVADRLASFQRKINNGKHVDTYLLAKLSDQETDAVLQKRAQDLIPRAEQEVKAQMEAERVAEINRKERERVEAAQRAARLERERLEAIQQAERAERERLERIEKEREREEKARQEQIRQEQIRQEQIRQQRAEEERRAQKVVRQQALVTRTPTSVVRQQPSAVDSFFGRGLFMSAPGAVVSSNSLSSNVFDEMSRPDWFQNQVRRNHAWFQAASKQMNEEYEADVRKMFGNR